MFFQCDYNNFIDKLLNVSDVQIGFRLFYQKLGIYCERTEPYVLFEVLSIVLFFLRLARILIQ